MKILLQACTNQLHEITATTASPTTTAQPLWQRNRMVMSAIRSRLELEPDYPRSTRRRSLSSFEVEFRMVWTSDFEALCFEPPTKEEVDLAGGLACRRSRTWRCGWSRAALQPLGLNKLGPSRSAPNELDSNQQEPV